MLLRLTYRPLMALALVLAMSQLLPAAPPVIGVAMAKGNFRVNDSPVVGNANLFEGALVETGKASSSIRIEKGATLSLASGSRGRVYEDRLVLERGTGELGTANGYQMEALGLRIETTSPGTSARVAVQEGGKLVQVAALSGPVRVLSGGFLIGNLAAGRSLEFEPQSAGAAAPSSMSGCLVKTDGNYFLTENTSGVKVQLLGSNLDREAGNMVEVVGTTVANQQVQVNKIHRLSRGCAAAGTAAGAGSGSGSGAAGAAGTAAKVGMAVTTKAIIAGVAVAAAAGTGVVAYNASQDNSTPSSR